MRRSLEGEKRVESPGDIGPSNPRSVPLIFAFESRHACLRGDGGEETRRTGSPRNFFDRAESTIFEPRSSSERRSSVNGGRGRDGGLATDSCFSTKMSKVTAPAGIGQRYRREARRTFVTISHTPAGPYLGRRKGGRSSEEKREREKAIVTRTRNSPGSLAA